MKDTVIIIPTRLGAKRFKNKPLAKINGIPMIIHVLNRAKESGVGEVFVTTPDSEIIDIVKKYGGQAILTKYDHPSGSDRVYEAYSKQLKGNVDLIINLQGDMPNLNPDDIITLRDYLKSKKCHMVTLASDLKDEEELRDRNVVKVITKKTIENSDFSEALDFKREVTDKEDKYIYHHIGIYGFTKEALIRYVNLKRSKLEIERNLEQMRALEDKMKIHVGFTRSKPLSVDTEQDLLKIKKVME